MKADILRRAEAIFEEEEEEDTRRGSGVPTEQTSGQEIFSAEDELEEAGGLKIKVAGDGEETDEGDADDDDEPRGDEKMTAEVMLELAWMRDPNLFDRGAVTRRSKERERLRKDTGTLSLLAFLLPICIQVSFQVGPTNRLRGGRLCLIAM